MGDPAEDRARAAELHEDDVVGVLYAQHARITETFERVLAVTESDTGRRHDLFGELRTLLVAHETAEEMVVRPATMRAGADTVADTRNDEEAEATEVLARLEDLEVGDPEFTRLLTQLRDAVVEHAEAEEQEEFPVLLEHCTEEERQRMGRQLRAVEKVAPTHAHPTAAGSPAAQALLGPFAAVADRTRDAIHAVLD